MKKYILTIAFIFVTFTMIPIVRAEQDDAYFLTLISRDQKAEKSRSDYAFYLYTKKRFGDARQQLGFLFALNAKHAEGKRLLKSIDEVEGLQDSVYQDQQMRVYMLARMQAEKDEIAEKSPPLQSATGDLSPEKLELIKKDLDKRYGLSVKAKTEIRPQAGEVVYIENLSKMVKVGDHAGAEKTAREWMSKFEKSPIAKADFALFLLTRDRLPQAEALLQDAMTTNPDYMKLRVISDGIKDLKLVKSSEQTNAIRARIYEEIQVYQQALNQDSRIPSANVATPEPVLPHK